MNSKFLPIVNSFLQLFLRLTDFCCSHGKTRSKRVSFSTHPITKTLFSRILLVNKRSDRKAMLTNFLPILLIFASEVLLTSANHRQKRENAPGCGIPSKATSLVIRGSDFQRGTWPWMVPLLSKVKSPPRLFCGGVLVSQTKVLTGENHRNAKSQHYQTGFILSQLRIASKTKIRRHASYRVISC